MKTAIELLTDLGKVGYFEETVEIVDGIKVTLKTLSTKEETEVFDKLKNLEGIQFFNKNKVETLARSIVKINEINFNTEVKVKKVEAPEGMSQEEIDKKVAEDIKRKEEEVIEKKVEIISNWSAAIIDELFKLYTNLIEKTEKKYNFKEEKKK